MTCVLTALVSFCSALVPIGIEHAVEWRIADVMHVHDLEALGLVLGGQPSLMSSMVVMVARPLPRSVIYQTECAAIYAAWHRTQTRHRTQSGLTPSKPALRPQSNGSPHTAANRFWRR